MNHRQMLGLLAALLFGAATQNCGGAPEDATGVAPPEQEQTSQIEEVEAERGINLYKQTKTIIDEHQNSVTLLVASESAKVVEDFLAGTDLSLEMVDGSAKRPESDDGDLLPGDEDAVEKPNPRLLMLEVVDRSFGPDTKAFTLKFRGRETVLPGSPGPKSLSAEYESALFIEGFQIDYLGLTCGTCSFSGINVEHWSRACALCSYKLWASKNLSPGQSWQTCHDARRTKAKILGVLPNSFYNWNFTFWNCS